jgi:hypothetical protein
LNALSIPGQISFTKETWLNAETIIILAKKDKIDFFIIGYLG